MDLHVVARYEESWLCENPCAIISGPDTVERKMSSRTLFVGMALLGAAVVSATPLSAQSSAEGATAKQREMLNGAEQ